MQIERVPPFLDLRAFGKPAAEATRAEQTLLSEVLALRTILINIIYDQANGHEDPRPSGCGS